MSMKKLVGDIQRDREIKITDEIFAELKLESQIDAMIVRLVIHDLMKDKGLFDSVVYESKKDSSEISLAKIVLSLMPAAAVSLGKLVEGTELTEENAKKFRASLAQNLDKDYSDETLKEK